MEAHGIALQHERFPISSSIKERKKEMNRMIWWLDCLSIAMLIAAGSWLILTFGDMLSVSGLLPVQSLALVAAVAVKGFSGPSEKSRNDNVLR